MSRRKPLAKVINIRVEQGEADLFFATSPELKGLLVAERTIEELDSVIPRAIVEMYAACGERVFVSKLDDGGEDSQPWVAFPAEIAEMAQA